MSKVHHLASSLVIILCIGVTSSTKYTPDWASLDTRPLPAWFDEGKIGIMLHVGVFSVPSFGSEWFWDEWKANVPSYVNFMKHNYPPEFTYPDFAPKFTFEFFNPDEWAKFLSDAGAKYVILTTKHHEGFTNWPSKFSFNWNSMDVGPKRDIVGELAAAVRKRGDVHFGVYHSLYEWFNPLYLVDKANHYKSQNFIKEKLMPEMYELVNNYKPEIFWSDGDWDAKDVYWNSTEFVAWLYNESPVKDTVIVNDRWGNNTRCIHGGYWNCKDRYNPRVLLKHKWENIMTMDKKAGAYRREATLRDYYTMEELIENLVSTVSCGGNLLINVGITHDGRVIPVFEERLMKMRKWLDVNGEAIYSTKPWTHQNDTLTPGVWYTSKETVNGTVVYAIVLDWPKINLLLLGAPDMADDTTVSMVGYPGELKWVPGTISGVVVEIPPIPYGKLPCQYAWVFKFTNLKKG